MEAGTIPTLRSELRRGLNLYNLGVGLLSSVVLGIGIYPFTSAEVALLSGAALFVIITGMHVAVHAYFGWRFERGVAALSSGDHAKALRLLSIAERPGIDHYDLDGSVRRLLATLRDRA